MTLAPPVGLPDVGLDKLGLWAQDQIGRDPVALIMAAGITPDPWQVTVLTSAAPRIIMLCSRQSGKSTMVAARAMYQAQSQAASLTIIGSPSQNQSAELLRKAISVYNVGGADLHTSSESILRVTLANKSRLLCVPGTSGTVRGYSAAGLIVIDEAAYVEDAFYEAVLPMVAVSGGQVILLSTPHAKAGAFFNIWESAPEFDPSRPVDDQPDAWLKIKVPWQDCPRIKPSVVDEYRALNGDFATAREFECVFADAIDQVFTADEVSSMTRAEITTWALF